MSSRIKRTIASRRPPPFIGRSRALNITSGSWTVLFSWTSWITTEERAARWSPYRIEATATFYWPKPSAQHYEWKLDRSLQLDKLDHDRREGGKVVTVELRKKGKNWRSEIKGKNVKKVKQDMGQRQSVEIDFGSPLFQWITFRHLKLVEGEKKGIEVILLETPGPKVKRIKRTYTRLPDEEVQAQVQGKVVASVYEITQSESSYRLWLDPSGFPIRTERETPEGPLRQAPAGLVTISRVVP